MQTLCRLTVTRARAGWYRRAILPCGLLIQEPRADGRRSFAMLAKEMTSRVFHEDLASVGLDLNELAHFERRQQHTLTNGIAHALPCSIGDVSFAMRTVVTSKLVTC